MCIHAGLFAEGTHPDPGGQHWPTGHVHPMQVVMMQLSHKHGKHQLGKQINIHKGAKS